MRIGKLSLALGLLCFSGLTYHPAQANPAAKAPEIYFYPKQGWLVQPTKAGSTSGSPVCSLSNEFNNGFIVTVQGSREGFTHINIDFRQNLFEEGDSFVSDVTIPGVSNNLLNARALNSSTMSLKLNQAGEFSQKLARSSVFDMKLQDNFFRFYMSGFAPAMQSFTQCVGGPLQPAAQPAGEPDPVRQAGIEQSSKKPPFDIKQAAAEISEQARQDLESGPADLPPSDKEARVVSGEPMPLNETSFVPIQEVFPEDRVANIRVEEDTSFNTRPQPRANRMSEQLADQMKKDDVRNIGNFKAGSAETVPSESSEPVKPAAVSIVEPSLMPAPLLAGEQSAASPKEENKNQEIISASPETVSDETPEVVAAPKPKIKVNKKVSTVEVDFTEAMAAAIEPAAASDEQDAFKAQDFGSVQECRVEPAQFKDLQSELTRLESKNQLLETELEQALSEAREERMRISSENWNLEAATMKFNEAERQIASLGRQVQRERAQCTAEKRELEQMLFDPKLADQQTLATFAKMEDQIRAYEQRIEQLEARLAAASAQ